MQIEIELHSIWCEFTSDQFSPFGDFSEVVCVIFLPSAGADILWIHIFTCQHGLTRFTWFHGTYQMFYFCVRCCHTLCPLTRITIKGHHNLYLTSKNELMPTCFQSQLFHLYISEDIIFATYICQ